MSKPHNDGDIKIERASPEDAEEISELLRITWLDTYPNSEAGITREDIRLRTDGKDGERIPQNIEKWRQRIQINDGSMAVFVARLDGQIVGMAVPRVDDGIHRLGGMYVLPDAQGRGVGARLMQTVIDWHGPGKPIHLLVARYNSKAITFYERYGFEKTDKKVVDEGNVYGDTRIPEIEMVRKA